MPRSSVCGFPSRRKTAPPARKTVQKSAVGERGKMGSRVAEFLTAAKDQRSREKCVKAIGRNHWFFIIIKLSYHLRRPPSPRHHRGAHRDLPALFRRQPCRAKGFAGRERAVSGRCSRTTSGCSPPSNSGKTGRSSPQPPKKKPLKKPRAMIQSVPKSPVGYRKKNQASLS